MKTKYSPVDVEPENQHIDCHNVVDMNKMFVRDAIN